MPDAVAGVRRAVRELVDGTLRVTLDIEPRDRAAFWGLFPDIDMPAALAPLRLDAPRDPEYGQQAQVLYLSAFFRSSLTAEQIGTDEEYLQWLRERECLSCKAPPPSQAAHVRRVADGAGTGIKPAFSAVPLCATCHEAQHQHGESKIGGRMWLDIQRDKLRHQWGWETLKQSLGYAHWSEVPPHVLREWANERHLGPLLPDEYTDAA